MVSPHQMRNPKRLTFRSMISASMIVALLLKSAMLPNQGNSSTWAG